LLKLFKNGSKRFEKDMSVEQIVRYLRDVRVYMKSRVLNNRMKFEILHSHKSVIPMDEDLYS
jgi:hypothetical protein